MTEEFHKLVGWIGACIGLLFLFLGFIQKDIYALVFGGFLTLILVLILISEKKEVKEE